MARGRAGQERIRTLTAGVAAAVLAADLAAAVPGPPMAIGDFLRLSIEDPRASLERGESLLASTWAAGRPDWRREVLLRMARAASLLADSQAVKAAVARLAAMGAEGDGVAAAYAQFVRASAWAESGQVAEALDDATRAATSLDGTGDTRLMATAAGELCDVVGRAGRSDLAAEHCGRARRLWAELGGPYQLGRVDNYLSMVARDQGRVDDAIRIARLAKEELRRAGIPALVTMMDDSRAGMYLEKGDGATALALSEGTLRLELAAGKAQHAVLSRMNIARALSLLGRHDEARAAIAEIQARYLALEKQRQIDRLAHGKRIGELQLAAANEMVRRQRLGIVLVALAGSSVAAVAALLLALLRAGRRRERELHVLSRTDPLTGAATRRAFMEVATKALAEAGAPAALVVIDADHFKQLNDRWGHLAGDQALQSLVARVRGEIRAGDRLARLGGEEFGLVLPGIGAEEAVRRSEAIRAAIAGAPHDLGGVAVAFTVSLGVAVAEPGSGASVEQWLGAADAALYEAKRAGRGRVDAGRSGSR